MNVKVIGKTLVGFVGGKIRNKTVSEVTNDLLEELLNMNDEEALDFFETDQKTPIEIELEKTYLEAKEKAEAIQDILDLMKDIKDNGHEYLEVKENSVYMKGINISMPELLVRAFINADETKIKSLQNFWINCAQNEDPRARHDLFTYLSKGKFTITPYGFFVGYRNVIPVTSSNDKQYDAIVLEYNKIKRWKKSPKDYYVNPTSNGNVKASRKKEKGCLGNLADLFNKGAKKTETIFTDGYTRSMEIKLGEPVSMDRSKCNANPNQTCSAGLHIGTREFLGSGNYFGSQAIVVLVNPKDVVAVPKEYTMGKMRVCKYLPVELAERDKSGYIKEIETDIYEEEMIEDLEEMLDEMSKLSGQKLEEFKKHNFIAPELMAQDVKRIKELTTINLKDANNVVKNRTI